VSTIASIVNLPGFWPIPAMVVCFPRALSRLALHCWVLHPLLWFAGGTSIARMGAPGSDFWSIVFCGQICHLWQLKRAESGDAGGCCFFSSDSYGAGMVSPLYCACLGPLAVPARSGGCHRVGSWRSFVAAQPAPTHHDSAFRIL
jgi:hypothetical protein